ncbi:MAG: glycosyltransferase family 39 protein [Armatimonadota bacterium]|nr:glycosyltransferase family 39 protein [bacterium]MDW8319773.1 glycosyltransferase family 39 protein [Armatimonadota bacterium]
MDTRSRKSPLVAVLPVALPVIALGMGCFFGLSAVGLFDLDEGLYATAARQMVESGDWLVPRVGTGVFFDKPPLTYWLQALCMGALGFTPLAARLPSAVAAVLTALVLWQWAKRRELERVGWLALIIYPLCPLTMGLARQAIMDSLLTLWFTLAIIGWIEGYTSNRRGYLLMAAGAGLATMTKGLIGLLLPAATLMLWILLRRDWAELKRIPWLPVLGVYLLIVLPWHLAVWRTAGDLFVQEYIIRHHVNRFLGKEFGHTAPFWFYLPVLLVGMYPWSAFVPVVGWQVLSGWRCEKQKLCCAWAMWALWAAVVLLFFSASKSKLPGYILPAVPALALLVALRLHSLWRTHGSLRPGEAALMGFTGLALSALFALVGVLGWQWQGQYHAMLMGKSVPPEVVQAISHIMPFALMLAGLFLLSVIVLFARWSSTPRVTGAAMLFGLLFIFLVGHDGLPRWNAYDIEPLHRLGRSLVPVLEQGKSVAIYAFEPSRPSLRFIMGHPQQVSEPGTPEALRRVMQNTSGGYILTEQRHSLPVDLPCRPVREREDGRWVIYRCEPSER